MDLMVESRCHASNQGYLPYLCKIETVYTIVEVGKFHKHSTKVIFLWWGEDDKGQMSGVSFICIEQKNTQPSRNRNVHNYKTTFYYFKSNFYYSNTWCLQLLSLVIENSELHSCIHGIYFLCLTQVCNYSYSVVTYS